MKKEVKRSGKKLNKILWLAIALIVVILIGMGTYEFIFRTVKCGSSSCFEDALANCNKVSWTRENNIAAWNYAILGSNDENSCRIKVTLLRLNTGNIGLEILQGKEMTCNFLKADTQFPEKDMSRCSGELKEKIQEILIQRMHDYMLKNLGQINEEFSSF